MTEAGNILAAFSKPYIVSRANSATIYIKGTAQNQTRSDVDISASIQPAKGAETMVLDEAKRKIDTIKIYTETQLLIGDKETGIPADKITYNSRTYILMHEFTFDMDTLNHHKYLAQLVQGNV